MSHRNTLIRSLHDLGLSAWFGGSLMGAVGLNGATGRAEDPTERLHLSSLGWKLWSPVAAVAIVAHAVGGGGLVLADRRRVAQQDGAGLNTAVKATITVAAAALTAYSGVLGARVEEHSHEGAEGATEPSPGASTTLADAQRRLRVVQWAIPALTGVLVVMAAQQGEQQRPVEQLRSRLLGG